MWETFALAGALAMDAMAVAALRGLQNRTRGGHGRDALILPLLFGVFQAGMAALGSALGTWGGPYVERFDHWIAFVLLVAIGGRMVWGSIKVKKAEDEAAAGNSSLMLDLGLAVATSIDAAAAGITLPMLPVTFVTAFTIIGVVTVVACAIGYALGKAAGKHLGAKLELIGGIILVALGVRVLVQHLM